MSLATLFVLCRFVHFAAVMLMFGSSLFTALLSPQRLSPYLTRDVRPLLVSCTWLAGLSAIALLAIQAGQMGDGWADTWRLDVWWAVLGTTFGEVWRWHLGISMLALLSLWLAEPRRTQLLALLSTLLLVSMAFIGHAAMHGGGLAHCIVSITRCTCWRPGTGLAACCRCWSVCAIWPNRSGAATR